MMSRLYLVTGFLGAGKTTFLKGFLKMFPGERIHVIVNEFGREGVDGELLREVGAVLDEINNGSIFCSCRLDKFEEVLTSVQKTEPDVIVVEASGLSDPTNIKKIMGQEDKFPGVEYRGSICLADAVNFLKVYETARVVKKQINVSDMILLNKTDRVSAEQAEKVKHAIRMQRPDLAVYLTTYGRIEPEWLEKMEHRKDEETGEIFQSADITLRKGLLYINRETAVETLRKFIEMFIEDTYRVKGFVNLQGQWYLVDCVGNIFHAQQCEAKTGKENALVVLSGYGLPVKRSVKKAMEWYPDVVKKCDFH